MAGATTRMSSALAITLVVAAVGVLSGCGSTELALDRPASGLLPVEVDGYSVSASPQSADTLNQLKAIGPGIADSAGAGLQKDGQGSGLEVYALKGSRNALNAVTLTLIRSTGGGREGDAWGAAEQGEKYQHTTTEIDGIKVEQVSAVAGESQLADSWLIARASDGVLLIAHNESGSAESGIAAMEGLIAGASK